MLWGKCNVDIRIKSMWITWMDAQGLSSVKYLLSFLSRSGKIVTATSSHKPLMCFFYSQTNVRTKYLAVWLLPVVRLCVLVTMPFSSIYFLLQWFYGWKNVFLSKLWALCMLRLCTMWLGWCVYRLCLTTLVAPNITFIYAEVTLAYLSNLIKKSCTEFVLWGSLQASIFLLTR